jgi:hypothetical protein
MKLRRVLAIDPGRDTGWAYFVNGKLVGCGHISIEKIFKKRPHETFGISNFGGVEVIIEGPAIYPVGKKQKGGRIPDSAIVKLALRTGEIRQLLRAEGATTAYTEQPKEWKGNVPKDVTERRVLAILDEEETKLIYSTMSARSKTLNNNMVDAVGIGLWKIRRKYHCETQHVRRH